MSQTCTACGTSLDPERDPGSRYRICWECGRVNERAPRPRSIRVVCQGARRPSCRFVGYRVRDLRAPCPRCGDKVQVIHPPT